MVGYSSIANLGVLGNNIECAKDLVEDVNQYERSGETREFPTLKQLHNTWDMCAKALKQLESDAAIVSAVTLGLEGPGSLTMDHWTRFKADSRD